MSGGTTVVLDATEVSNRVLWGECSDILNAFLLLDPVTVAPGGAGSVGPATHPSVRHLVHASGEDCCPAVHPTAQDLRDRTCCPHG